MALSLAQDPVAVRLEVIRDITAATTAAPDAASLWAAATDALRARLPGTALHVLSTDASGRLQAAEHPFPACSPPHRRALTEGSTVIVHDVAENAHTADRRDAWLRSGTGAFVDVPVRLPRDEHLAGVLRLTAPAPAVWPPETLELLDDAARHLSLGLQLHTASLPAVPALTDPSPLDDVREHLNLALDAAHMGLWVWDLATGRVHWSANLAATLGIPAHLFESTIDSYRALVHPDDRAALRADFAEALRTGTFTTEHRLVRPDGSTVWVTSVGYAKFSAAGQPIQLVGTSRNVTHRKWTEEELLESKRRLSLALDAAQLGLWDFDYRTQTNTVDERWAAQLGYELHEVDPSADFFWSLVHPDDVPQAQANLIPYDDGDASYLSAEMRLRKKDGSWCWILSLGQIVQWNPDGTPRRAVGIHLDITQRKEAEQALRRAKEEAEEMNRLKSTFLANMSHEIRTPLTAVIGFASILTDEVPDGKRELAEYIERAGQRLLSTLNSVLDLSMLESGNLKLQPETVDLNAEVAAKVALLKPLADKKHVSLVVETPEAPCPLQLDRSCLDRILNNLVGNAIKFTAEGTVTVSVRPGAETVEFAVADTGIGIDDAFLPHLFAAFEQESAGMARTHEGSGLGLTITKHLVDLLGGRIEVVSRKDEGTTFTVHLPRAASDAPGTARAVPAWPERTQAPCRVLILDDDPAVPELLRLLLPDAFELTTTHTADDALAQAAETPFDVVLLDINLSEGRSGTDVLQALRRREPYRTTPCVAVTAYALPGDEQRFLSHGFDAYLSKPFTRQHLHAVLIDVLERPPT